MLFLAVNEALHDPINVDRTHFLHMFQDTRDYLTKPNKNLAMACAMVGVDMQAVIERMKAQIANAPSPEELMVKPRTKTVI